MDTSAPASPLPDLRIAAAQSVSVPGDIGANVAEHLRLIDLAARAGVQLLLFPELSLSGYEPALLAGCAVLPDDAALAPLRQRAIDTGMQLLVGAPMAVPGPLPAIGAISYGPDGHSTRYHKRYLHPGEDLFASAGTQPSHTLHAAGSLCAVAVCADVTHSQHAQDAAATGAGIYLASMLVSEAGYAADAAHLARHARSHGFAVLMANHGAPSGGYAVAGRSALWAPGGALVVSAPGAGSCLVVARRSTGVWSGDVLPA